MAKEFHVFHRHLKKMKLLQISRKMHFFANQCSSIKNNSQLPRTLSYKTNEKLSSVKITDNDMLKIFAKLDLNKTHGHDKVSIRMIKICTTSICKPLRLIFNHCIDNSMYPCDWKKSNVVPFHKKSDKQTKLSSSVFTCNLQ